VKSGLKNIESSESCQPSRAIRKLNKGFRTFWPEGE